MKTFPAHSVQEGRRGGTMVWTARGKTLWLKISSYYTYSFLFSHLNLFGLNVILDFFNYLD